MAGQTFGAAVAGWATETKEWQRDVFRMSAQDAAAQMQLVGPSVYNPSAGEGGRMPIGKTAFLQHSLQVTMNEAPAGFLPTPKGDAKFSYDPGATNLAIAEAKTTDRIFVTLGAEYGRFVDYRYQFTTFAADQWQATVSKNAAEARKKK